MNFTNSQFPNFQQLFQNNNIVSIAQQDAMKNERSQLSSFPNPKCTRESLTNQHQFLVETYKKRKDKQHLKELVNYLDQHLSDDIEMEHISRHLGMSYTALYRLVKSTTQLTPSLFIRSYRLKQSVYLLKNTTLNISEIAYDVGFKDPNYFSRTFKAMFGVSPRKWRR